MTNSENSIDKIKEKILSEAHEEEKRILDEAEKDAEKIAADYRNKAQAVRERILSAANETASVSLSSAKSARNMQEKNARLTAKVALLDEAYARAKTALEALDRENALSIFAGYLSSAAEALPKEDNGAPEKAAASKAVPSKAVLSMCAGSVITAQELIDACKALPNADRIVPGAPNNTPGAGFFLEIGDITVDCSAETIIRAARGRTETGVAAILFADSAAGSAENAPS